MTETNDMKDMKDMKITIITATRKIRDDQPSPSSHISTYHPPTNPPIHPSTHSSTHPSLRTINPNNEPSSTRLIPPLQPPSPVHPHHVLPIIARWLVARLLGQVGKHVVGLAAHRGAQLVDQAAGAGGEGAHPGVALEGVLEGEEDGDVLGVEGRGGVDGWWEGVRRWGGRGLEEGMDIGRMERWGEVERVR